MSDPSPTQIAARPKAGGGVWGSYVEYLVTLEAGRAAVLELHEKELDKREGPGETLYIDVCHCCGDDWPCATRQALGGDDHE